MNKEVLFIVFLIYIVASLIFVFWNEVINHRRASGGCVSFYQNTRLDLFVRRCFGWMYWFGDRVIGSIDFRP